ncbi:nucleotide sugar dehydrogenase [Cryomorphaceae bacterium]|nr:nucleotide sugar dehydrogenase [Cryomorphaceae bacterium]
MNKKIAIIGLGYVGMPLVAEFGKSRKVIAFDINPERVDELLAGYDRTLEVSRETLTEIRDNVEYTTNSAELDQAQIFIVTVPTPIDKNNTPDLTPLQKSSESVGLHLKIGDIVIYESTVYPGVTEEVCVPILERVSGLKFNRDFFAGYSPERINPGDKKNTLTNIIKVTSGSTPEIADEVDELYSSIVKAGTYRASSIKVAEAAKVIENTQRDINIAIINELALIFDHMGIDTREVLAAASTKWNFLQFQPGLVGGHCIGVDPYYLMYRSEELGYRPNLILASRQINNGMGKFIAEKTVKLLIGRGQRVRGAKVLILGVTFKENTPDVRNTRVVDIMQELKEYGCEVSAYDPWVDPNEKNKKERYLLIDDPWAGNTKYDAIIVSVAHREFVELRRSDYDRVLSQSGILIDVKGIVISPDWRL